MNNDRVVTKKVWNTPELKKISIEQITSNLSGTGADGSKPSRS